MIKITIEWKHFEKYDRTCDRCSNTGANLKKVIQEVTPYLSSQGYSIEFTEIKLDSKDMSESNTLLINEVPIEHLLNALVNQNSCSSCSDLINGPCECRTITLDNNTYEAIPSELIKKAILISLKKESNYLKGIR